MIVVKGVESTEYYFHHKREYHVMGVKLQVFLDILLAIILLFFIAEFLIRFKFCTDRKYFMLRLINILDLIGIVSLALGIILHYLARDDLAQGRTFLHVLAWNFWICRCFRLIWFMRMSSFSLTFMFMLRKAWRDILAIFISFSVLCVIYSAPFCYAEYTDYPINMFEALWWAFITMATVGYGDIYPVTIYGKCVSVMCALTGVVFYACVATVVVTNFMEYKQNGKYQKPKAESSKCCKFC